MAAVDVPNLVGARIVARVATPDDVLTSLTNSAWREPSPHPRRLRRSASPTDLTRPPTDLGVVCAWIGGT